MELLKSIEEKNKYCVIPNNTIAVNETKQKKFITFPYPYMNGRLHLGHGLTILNADMQARFYVSCGYNVLFPFAYHGSGMPIVAIYVKKQVEHYGKLWCDWTNKSSLEEFEYVKEELGLLHGPSIKVISVETCDAQFKNNPGRPIIRKLH